jgi:hypothetical protein
MPSFSATPGTALRAWVPSLRPLSNARSSCSRSFSQAVPPYPFSTPIGLSLATFRPMPAWCTTSTTSATSL